MAESTKIAWCTSTFNPFIGCSKVSPGCDHCYAEQQDSRKRWDGGKTHWGPGVPRYRTSAANWRQPLTWNAKQTSMLAGDPNTPPWRVFCASLADVFDNEVPQEWREDLWDLIEETPNLEWLLVTKRIGNSLGMMPVRWCTGIPKNVRLIITVCNQDEAGRDIPKLLALNVKNGVSYEPALGPVDWWQIPVPGTHGDMCDLTDIQWIIIGGESGPKAGPFNVDWARSTRDQCKEAGTAFFMKQAGALPCMPCRRCEGKGFHHGFGEGGHDPDWCDRCGGQGLEWPKFKDRDGADPAEWPADLRVREFPE